MADIYTLARKMEEKRDSMTVEEFLEAYVKNTLGKKTKCGSRWSVVKEGEMEILTYTPSDYPEESEQVAYKLADGSVLSNANRLEYVGRRFAWGRERSRWGREEAPEQRWLQASGAIPIPFTLFKEANMDIKDFKWVVKPVAEDVIVIRPPAVYGGKPQRIRRHFSGACLFSIGEDTFLFDIDRQEIQANNIFNPFVTKLPKKASSIQEAYDILMPDEVREAIADGVEVLRQGEFFFIKHSDEFPLKVEMTDEEKKILRNPPSRFGYGIGDLTGRLTFTDDDRAPFKDDEAIDTPEKQDFQKAALEYKIVADKYIQISARPGTLGKSATGSHTVERYIKDGEIVYASGTIKQSRREHGDLKLTGWYRVAANTGTISWTIRGEID
jgi:hypothetical protein